MFSTNTIYLYDHEQNLPLAVINVSQIITLTKKLPNYKPTPSHCRPLMEILCHKSWVNYKCLRNQKPTIFFMVENFPSPLWIYFIMMSLIRQIYHIKIRSLLFWHLSQKKCQGKFQEKLLTWLTMDWTCAGFTNHSFKNSNSKINQ